MKNVLSIQSHVVYGYAGNKAAVFPMQLLGVDTWALNTVQFSNHTQYGKWKGMVIPKEQIGEIAQGIAEIEALHECDAILSGYIGAAEQGAEILAAVAKIKALNPNAIYFCDPVMGHPDKGCIVAPGVAEFLRDEAMAKADIIAPNLVELRELTGLPVLDFDGAIEAIRTILGKGVKKVLVKHLSRVGKDPSQFEMLLATQEGIWHISRPLHEFKAKDPVGVGDLTSGIFLANLLNGKSDVEAFEHTANAVNDVMSVTQQSGKYELQIIQARELIVHPQSRYQAVKIG
ncbi:Pyridoxamine kinase [Bibersteinia trehalosi USDA-ARS-USMARC-188]|uniref:Pyridoxal kinase PdxY n=5 Tax=Bibersteinia trehalosi TaxID=47735 RepID=W0RAR9_BIBTR|nr:pyridoxal kinase PdxY [Bibersteinia trehalosi]AGH39400.1 Pyridoxamine kinase [Bibersteinia trehalosi USDA-ARS-USMARC-192]AHG80854.1 Pyridoxamine kinase [Bibersteinia trehalosi USDA-ARS-USMARC-188]AHG83004.1 Pyridoxamine kinase [Bibersteinia trehalosi USDA-ARS-USMARC-189]AHG87405.1 Pyridoxamine kinase [Bibersteinia trehalosi USDA-ARS-USMARC-190]OAQ14087.1 pyridoxamine kinase [Bibersteinia trehalosi Y31]